MTSHSGSESAVLAAQRKGDGSTRSANSEPADAQRATPKSASPNGRTDGRLFPERPRLAAGVRLAGQMQESAFVDPPWLLERDGAGYVQVTELLFRIAERCSGNDTVEDIAAQISAAGKPVNPATVRTLIAQLLIPRGLVEMADGSVVPVASAGPSPLALNMRVKMVRPETIRPLTTLLRTLYWPPILVLTLIVAAIAEGWLYFIHGLGGGLHDAIYAPGLMLVVLLVIVLSAAFHELGHAAALHYGGGQIKGMGAGVYIVYPAFFTDVSDNYRLPRWARVRTDLGGFYFNLIFALGVMGLYLATQQEFLLLIVLMINLEILHQLLPFLRLDGYWTLADITGVPDFLSQMTAFARSVVPIKGLQQGRKLPALKWWGRVVFGAYIMTTVPLLALLLLLMIKSVPRVLATAWDSFGKQGQGFALAQSHMDILGMGGAASQALLLAIPVLGLGYTLLSVGRRFVVWVWTWSKPTLARRLAGGACMLSAAALLGFMWIPQLPRAEQPAGPLAPVNWEPIAPDERGTVQDAVAGVVATREPTGPNRASVTPQPTPTSASATDSRGGLQTATPPPVATAAVPVTDAQTRGTPAPTPAATTPATQRSNVATVAPTPLTTPARATVGPTAVRATSLVISGTATPTRTSAP